MNIFSGTGALSFRVLAGVAAFTLSGAALATATLAPGSTTADPTGIDNLVVGGTTYDVTFSTTSFNSTFTIGTSASQNAATALTNALNTLGVTALDGYTGPTDIGGGPFYLLALEDNTGFVCADGALLTYRSSWGSTTCASNPIGTTKGDIVLEAANFVSVGSTSVPEPATLALFGLGAAALGLSRRRLAR